MTCFVLDLTKSWTPEFKTDPPATYSFHGHVNVRNMHRIDVYAVHNFKPYKFDTVLDRKHMPVYKSNLQKCVRRRLHNNAVRTAYAMHSAETDDLLRRLPIIMIEDVVLHPCIVLLVWWMMAWTKGYRLSTVEIKYLLGIVYLLCDIEIRETTLDKKTFSAQQTDDYRNSMVKALMIRKSYGGMACDANLIDCICNSWHSRGIHAPEYDWWTQIWKKPVRHVILRTLDVCDKTDIIIESIDYHCFPWMLDKLCQSHPSISRDQIKSAIWIYSSNVNVRKQCCDRRDFIADPSIYPVYVEIAATVEQLAKWVYDKCID
jgi:hypothetical protein